MTTISNPLSNLKHSKDYSSSSHALLRQKKTHTKHNARHRKTTHICSLVPAEFIYSYCAPAEETVPFICNRQRAELFTIGGPRNSATTLISPFPIISTRVCRLVGPLFFHFPAKFTSNFSTPQFLAPTPDHCQGFIQEFYPLFRVPPNPTRLGDGPARSARPSLRDVPSFIWSSCWGCAVRSTFVVLAPPLLQWLCRFGPNAVDDEEVFVVGGRGEVLEFIHLRVNLSKMRRRFRPGKEYTIWWKSRGERARRLRDKAS